MFDTLALPGMFLIAFGAATLLPIQSEIVFVGIQLEGSTALLLLVLVASVGNTLGSVVNYVLGRGIETFRQRKWFPVTEAQMARAQGWYSKWGVWSLLVSWLPLGDALTVIAGVMRTPLWLFVVLVGFAKTSRYVALAWITAQFST